jgi:uncharacterized protein (DUF2252 family)
MTDRLTRKAAASSGEDARRRVPPESLAALALAGRPDPVALLESQAATRIADLVPVRYGRMAVSPFTFLRGAALPMAADLAAGPRSGVDTQICGDAHLANFGLFASPERDLMFDINDFDETLRGPFEFDLKRLAASLVVAARARGFTEHEGHHVTRRAIRSYVTRMTGYAAMRAIDVYYAHVDVTEILGYVGKHGRAMIEGTVKASAHHDAVHELPKLKTMVDGVPRLVEHPPTLVRRPVDEAPLAASVLARYRESLQEDRRDLLDRYSMVDYALKVVGVGSVGLGAFVGLFLGTDDEDPLFLQVKQAEASVYEPYLGASPLDSHGQRVVTGQRRLQAASDVLLGWAVGDGGRHWYVRQHQDQKASAAIDLMTVDDLATWGELCGWALARGHARSGSPAAIGAYVGTDGSFERAILAFAETYADQSERDHAALRAAISGGRVAALEGV